MLAIYVADIIYPVLQQLAEFTRSQTITFLQLQSFAPAPVNKQVILSLRGWSFWSEGDVDCIVTNAPDVVLTRLAYIIGTEVHFQGNIAVGKNLPRNDMNSMSIRAWLECLLPSSVIGDDVDKVVRFYTDHVGHFFPISKTQIG